MARHQQFTVSLTTEERKVLETGCKSGGWGPRKVRRAKALLYADNNIANGERPLKVEEITQKTELSPPTIVNLKKRFQKERLGALEDKPRSGRPRVVDGEVEAQMIAISCSEAPAGRERWTLRLIADKLVTLVEDVESISHTTVGNALKKTNSNPG